MFHQRLVNLLLSTCRAHRRLFTSPGGQLRELFQIGVVRGNIPLGISVLSYSGQLNTAVVAAADAIADSV
ncbi:hypothetical protein SRABI83_02947 [Arthrobacter sp. Bi83]|uniref:hypothetical protein n=1 Tax=Arthrobacter sp. Bi83 TaxID=2822353 RepID=UPI001D904A91|nr:hypothetical protein [Arthrobacter sp. Bi83]CAH0243882.1 hypothetical protein SRABI83_02947 [Arthrobacter sp. Bi83]